VKRTIELQRVRVKLTCERIGFGGRKSLMSNAVENSFDSLESKLFDNLSPQSIISTFEAPSEKGNNFAIEMMAGGRTCFII
jgi:hypothetical protein